MLREEIKIISGKKEYIIYEPTVGLYWLSLDNPERFLREVFLEKNIDIPDMSQDQLLHLIYELLGVSEDLKTDLLKKQQAQNHSFHIVVGQFMKFFGNGFEDTLKIPFRIFKKMLEDIQIISGENEEKEEVKSDTPDKAKLKQIFSKQ